MNKIVILGAGISGLGAAYELKDYNPIVLEKERYYGGLCNSFEINDFIFDRAIHLSFTKKEKVRNIFDKTPYFSHNPNPHNFYNNLWLKHPVQFNLFKLSPELKTKAIKSFINTSDSIEDPKNYKEWLYNQYGHYIANKFPLKYTKKYWATDADKLSINWIGNRMKKVDIEDVLLGSFTEGTGNNYYADEMRYPQNNGYMNFLEPLRKGTNIEFNKKITQIDTKRKVLTINKKEKVEYDQLISSIPITEMVELVKDIPDEIKSDGRELNYTSIILVSIGFDCEDIYDYLWYYIYDEDILASRIHSPSIKSINNAPDGFSSIQMEIYFNEKQPQFSLKKEDIEENIYYSLKKLGYPIEAIKFIDIRTQKYGNVIFDQGMEKKRDKVKNYLENEDIKLIGRFGEWGYLWSDQSLMSGIRTAKSLKDDFFF